MKKRFTLASITFFLIGILACQTFFSIRNPAYAGISSATGGTITTVGNDKVHTFTSSGTFAVTGSGNVRVLVVGAGGGGGTDHAGGGGGGEVVYNASYAASGNIAVLIGAGGAGGNAGRSTDSYGRDGGSSVFGTITAIGGGGGGTYGSGDVTAAKGRNGASGGGGAFTQYGNNGGGIGLVHYNGGPGGTTDGIWGGGGGGGAGGAGQSGVGITAGGNGGPGVSSDISGSTLYYAAGGGAGGAYALAGGTGGSSIGGNGGTIGQVTAGAANTGSGGGGGNAPGTYAGGAGADGIVIVRYTPQYILTVAKAGTGAGTVTSDPVGISCGGDCSESYNSGTSVTITPAPDAGFTFTGWSGTCTGTGTCQVTMDAVKSVTATFNDTTPPTSPVSSTITTPTNNQKPTWTWSPGGGGNGTYRYKLDNSDLTMGATETTATSYTPATNLSEGSHTLYVQERDAAGNWSESGSYAILIDTMAPAQGESGANSPVIWSRQFGTAGEEHGSDITVDGSKNIYVSGFTQGSLEGSINLGGGSNGFLIKYDASGTKLWTRQFGSDFAKIAVDSIGNVYVTGRTTGSFEGYQNLGSEDIFLIKLNSSGEKQWVRQWGTSGVDVGYDIAVDNLGNVYVTGRVGGGSSGYNIILTKYDASGVLQWTRQSGSPGYNTGLGIACDKTGNIYITGYTGDNLDGNQHAGGVLDAFLMKYDSSGNKFWTRQLGTSSADYGNAVAVDDSDHIFIAGHTSGSFAPYVNPGPGSPDIYLASYDASGNKLWVRQWGTAGEDVAQSIYVDSKSGVYVAGYTQGGLDGNTYFGANDIFITKYDVSGTKQWTRQMGTSASDAAFGIVADNASNYYITGNTWNSLFGYTNAGSSDAFLVKMGDYSVPISINAGGAATQNISVSLSLSAYDANGVSQMMISNDTSFSGAAVEDYAVAKAWTLPVGDGEKTVYVKFKDAAGNWSLVYSDTITLDTTAPVTTIGSKPAAATNSTSASFTFLSESGATFQCQLDNGSWGSCTTPVNYTSLETGNHTFSIKATDTTGNTETPVSYAWTVDMTAPNAPAVSGTTPTNNQKPTWTWASGGGGNGTFRYKLDSSDLTTGATETTATSYTPATNLSEGSHTLCVQERDVAGNWSATSSKEIVVDITAPSAGIPGMIQLPKTGQTICYDNAGTIISCTGTGQDGDILAGVAWPNPRFTDKGDQTVLDNLTGLIWAKDGNLMKTRDPGFDNDGTVGNGAVFWQHALDYIKKLNQENYLGHNDWRLPNVIELESLVNSGQSILADWLTSKGFTNVQADYYWLTSSDVRDANYAWTFSMYGMYGGDVPGGYKPSGAVRHFYVWPVRSGQSGSLGSSIISLPKTGQTTCYNASGSSIACASTGQDGELQMGVTWPNPRFTDKGDQTVKDNLTGLIWTKDGDGPGPTVCADIGRKWQDALDYVKCLNTNNYLGKNDWRLPNRKELWSLFHAGQDGILKWLNMQGFSNVVKNYNYYWSSTTIPGTTHYAYVVDMWAGNLHYGVKASNDYYVWPVRTEQPGILDNLGISLNSGVTLTTAINITLGLSATDANGVSKMMISNDASFTLSTEENYATTRSWTLPAGDGTKTVYVKFKDTVGNWSSVYSSSIKLDTTGPTVTANPAAGTYPTAQSVTLTCNDNSGSGCGNIYYTTNGADPFTGSAVYSSAISIPSTTTLKFFAVDALGTAGSIQTAAYILQSVSMTAGDIKVVKGETRQSTVTLTSVGGFNSSMDVSYAWQGTGPASVTMNLNPTAVIPTGSGATATLSLTAGSTTAAGAYTLSLTATGGGQTATKDIQVTVAAPLAWVTDPSISWEKGQATPPTITTSGGIGTPVLTVSAGTLPTGVTLSSNGAFSGTPTRGTYILTVQVADTDGHTLSKDYTVRVYDPAFRQLVLTADAWTVEKGSVSGSIFASVVNDYGNVENVTQNTIINLSSTSSTGRFSENYGTTFSGSSTYPITINQGFNIVEFQYKDTVAGAFRLTAAGKTGTVSSGWALTSHDVTVTDSVPVTLTVTKAGTGTGAVTSNPAGISCGSTCSAGYSAGTSVTLTAAADAGYTFAGWSGACTGTGACTVAMNAAQSVTVAFNDTTAPTVNTLSNQTKNVQFTQSGTAADANTMTYSWTMVDGPGNITFGTDKASSTTISASVDGTYTIRFTATDKAGNSSSKDMTLVWDTAAPVITLSGKPANPTNSSNADFTFSSEAGAVLKCQLDSSGFGTCISPKSYTGLSAGSHTFYVNATDGAGNTSAPTSYAWTIDTTPPAATITGKPASLTNATSSSFTFTSEQGTSFQCKLDTGSYAACNGTADYNNLTEGGHTFYLKTTNAAGNMSETNYSWTVDKTLPAGTASFTGGLTVTNNATVSLSLSATDANGVSKMMVSNNQNFTGATEESYATGKAWTLSTGDGNKTVYVKFKDAAGNWSQVYPAAIILDTIAPSVSVPIPGGTYQNGQSVTLTADETATIYYTTDNSTPTVSSTKYTGPITVSANTTLKFIAVDAAGNVTPVREEKYTFQSVGMLAGNIKVVQGETRQTNIVLISVGGFSTSMNLNSAWQGDVPANASVNMSPLAIIPTSIGAPATLSFTAGATTTLGSYTIRVTASGGGLTASADIPVTVAAPFSIVTDPSISAEKGQALPAITAAGGIGTVSFSYTGTLPTGVTFNGNGSFSGIASTRGTYKFSVQAKDDDGHTASRDYTARIYDPAYRALVMDATPWAVEKSKLSPTITLSAVDDYNRAADLPASIQLSATKGAFAIEGGSLSTNSSLKLSPYLYGATQSLSFQYTDSEAGNRTITVTSLADTANWQSTSHDISVDVPNLKKADLSLAVTDNKLYGQLVTISGKLIDKDALTPLPNREIAVNFIAPSGTPIAGSSTYTKSDGTFLFQVDTTTIDSAGNWRVKVQFKESQAAYNDASAEASFTVVKAGSNFTPMVLSGRSISPTGQMTISGQLTTTTGITLLGTEVLVDFFRPDGTLAFTGKATADKGGHFDYTSTATFDPVGFWTVKVRLAGNSNLNDSTSATTDFMVASTAGYAILIQGDLGGQYAENYVASLDDIYNKLTKRAFLKDNISYLGYPNIARDSQITFKETSRASIEDAITNWAHGQIKIGGIAPLYIVLMDHGSKGQFHIKNGSATDKITPEDLDRWLTTLEGKVQASLGKQLTTIVVDGSCYSGSFIPILSKSGRVIITSGADNEETVQGPAYEKAYGEYFIYWLFNNLSGGASLRDAFKDAANATQQFGCSGTNCGINSLNDQGNAKQHPLLDDNGDHKGSRLEEVGQADGAVTSRILLGLGKNPFNLALTEVMPTQTVLIGAAPVVAYAKTNDIDLAAGNTAAAWVEIRNPSFVMPTATGGTGQVIINLPKATGKFKAETNRWEFDVSQYLTEAGTYSLYYYAIASNGDITAPVRGTLYVNTSTNTPPDYVNLTNPANNQEVTDAWITFQWDKAADPDKDPVTYTLKIMDDAGNELKRYEQLTDGVLIINGGAEQRNDGTPLFVTGNYYRWQVDAIDSKGAYKDPTAAMVNRFKVTFTNVFNGFIVGKIDPAVSGASISTDKSSAKSLPNGYFFMPHLAGKFILNVVADGYAPYATDVTVGELSLATISVALSSNTPPAAPTLATVTTPTKTAVQTTQGTKDANSSVWLNGTQIIAADSLTTWSYALTLNEGNNALSLTAKNGAGLESSAVTGAILLDATAPQISAFDDQLRGAEFIQTGSVQDATALTYGWSQQSGPGTVSFGSPDKQSTTIRANADGSYIIRFQATDAAGNSSYRDMALLWDSSKPAVVIGNPSATVTKSGPVTYTVTYVGADSITLASADVKLDAIKSATGTVEVAGTTGNTRTVTLSGITGDGTLGITIAAGTARDNAGNSADASEASVTFTVDNTAPSTMADPGSGLYGSVQNVILKANEEAVIYYTTDGAMPSDKSSKYESPIPVNATMTLRYFAKDGAGNEEPVQSQDYTIDVTAPAGNMSINGGITKTSSRTISLNLAASDTNGEVRQMQFSMDGMTWTTAEDYARTKSFELPSSDGVKTIYVRFNDNVGNWSMPSTVTINLDTTAPVTTASPAGDLYIKTQNVTLSANEDAVIYYTTELNKPPELWSRYSAAIPIATTTTLKFFAKDAAGNVEQTKTELYTIDTSLNGIRGDLNGDDAVTLTDAIIAFQVMMRMPPQALRSDYTTSNADVNGDGRVGPAEVIYILQKAAKLR